MHAYYAFAVARQWSLAMRIAANSLVMDPVNISVAVMLSGVNKGLGSGLGLGEAVASAADRLRSNIVGTLTTSLMVWPPIHCVNWLLVPQRYRVLGFNMGSLGWNTYLTWKLWIIEKSLPAGAAATANAAEGQVTAGAGGKVALAAKAAPSNPVGSAPPHNPPVAVGSAPPQPPAIAVGSAASNATSSPVSSGAVGSGAAAGGRRCPFRGFFSSEPGEDKCTRPGKAPPAAVDRAKAASSPSPPPTLPPLPSSGSSPLGPHPPAACAGEGGGLGEGCKGDKVEGGKDEGESKDGSSGGRGRGGYLTAVDLKRVFGSDYLLAGGGSDDGGEVRVPMEALVGKTLAVYFSGEWCPPCKRFTPQLVNLYAILQARQAAGGGRDSEDGGVEFIFVAVDPSSQESFDACVLACPSQPLLPS